MHKVSVNLEFKKLTEVKEAELIDMMNDPLVFKHMPHFGHVDYEQFIATDLGPLNRDL